MAGLLPRHANPEDLVLLGLADLADELRVPKQRRAVEQLQQRRGLLGLPVDRHGVSVHFQPVEPAGRFDEPGDLLERIQVRPGAAVEMVQIPDAASGESEWPFGRRRFLRQRLEAGDLGPQQRELSALLVGPLGRQRRRQRHQDRRQRHGRHEHHPGVRASQRGRQQVRLQRPARARARQRRRVGERRAPQVEIRGAGLRASAASRPGPATSAPGASRSSDAASAALARSAHPGPPRGPDWPGSLHRPPVRAPRRSPGSRPRAGPQISATPSRAPPPRR